jgi:hypothetical protein
MTKRKSKLEELLDDMIMFLWGASSEELRSMSSAEHWQRRAQVINDIIAKARGQGLENRRFPMEINPWRVACFEARDMNNPQPLIDLHASGKPVPPEAMPYIEDLLNYGYRKHKKGHHSRPLYYTSQTEDAAVLVRYLVQEHNFLVREAIDDVSKFMDIDSNKIANFYMGISGHSQRIKARRNKNSSDPLGSISFSFSNATSQADELFVWLEQIG